MGKLNIEGSQPHVLHTLNLGTLLSIKEVVDAFEAMMCRTAATRMVFERWSVEKG